MKSNKAIAINFNQDKIFEATLMLSDIHVNKDELMKLRRDEVREIAFDVIKETAREILVVLMNKNDEELNDYLDEFIKQSNLRYLVNKVTKNIINLPQ